MFLFHHLGFVQDHEDRNETELRHTRRGKISSDCDYAIEKSAREEKYYNESTTKATGPNGVVYK